MKILRKAGPLQTIGSGTIWHAVEEGVAVNGGPALCRARPERYQTRSERTISQTSRRRTRAIR
jgi:hypothetical protein